MPSDVIVNFRGMDAIPAAEELCQREAAKLEKVFSGIVRTRVTVTRETTKHRTGHIWSVHLQVEVPGEDVQVKQEPTQGKEADELAPFLRQAFDRARRQLDERYANRKRGT
jgi:hypothetical protein